MTNKLTLDEFLERSVDGPTQIPKPPTIDELRLIRKGLRRKTIPDTNLLPDEFGYEGIGLFSKKITKDSLTFMWSPSESTPTKSATFHDLCMSEDHEMDRLEFGWLIANIARVDGITYLQKMRPISYEDYHQDQFAKQYSTQKTHFEKIEKEWRHWSVVPAGHMKIKSE
jgi:hypothetical protein